MRWINVARSCNVFGYTDGGPHKAYLSLSIIEDGVDIVARAEGILSVEDQLVRRIMKALIASPDLKNATLRFQIFATTNLDGLCWL